MVTKIYKQQCKKCDKVIESLYERQASSLMASHKQTHIGEKK